MEVMHNQTEHSSHSRNIYFAMLGGEVTKDLATVTCMKLKISLQQLLRKHNLSISPDIRYRVRQVPALLSLVVSSVAFVKLEMSV